MKQVQIPETLFFDLCEYFLWREAPDECDYIAADIAATLQEKVDKMLDRAAFTEYKTAPTPEQREQARRKYLDRRAISKNYRSENETRL